MGNYLDFIGRMSTSLICMTGMMPVFRTMLVDQERRSWREYCTSIFRKGLDPFPSDAPVSPPRSGRRDEVCLNVDDVDTIPPDHHMGSQDIAHVLTSVSDEDEDWSDTSVSSHVALDSDVVSVKERSVGVCGLPLTVGDLRFRSGASDGTLLSEDITWLCFFVICRCEDRRSWGDVDGLGRPESGSLAWGRLEPWYRGTTAYIPLL